MDINKINNKLQQTIHTFGIFIGIYLFSLFVYLSNKCFVPAVDTIPARYLSLSLFNEGNLDLNEFAEIKDYKKETGLLATFEVENKLLSAFPAGSAFLGAFFYSIGVKIGLRPEAEGLLWLEKWAAANILAITSALFYFLLIKTGTSFFVRLIAWIIFSFGSTNWVPCSQALWQHGPTEMMVIISLLLLPCYKDNKGIILRYVLSGVFLGLSVFMRPTTTVLIPVWAIILFLENRKIFFYFIIGAVIGLIPIIVYHLYYFGGIFGGGYFRLAKQENHFSNFNPLYYLAAHLFSPSRGLLIFIPFFILVPFSFLPKIYSYKPNGFYNLNLFGFSVLTLISVIAAYNKWWAGYGYGPRFWSEMLPFLCLLSIPTLNWLIKKNWGKAVIFFLVIYSIFIQVVGAWKYDEGWDSAVQVDKNPTACWQLYDNTILFCLTGGISHYGPVNTDKSYDIFNKLIKTSDENNKHFLRSGFYGQENWGVWTRGRYPAVILFSLPQKMDGWLLFKVAAHSSPINPKKIKCYLNGNFIGEYKFKNDIKSGLKPESFALLVPANFLTGGLEKLKIKCSEGNYYGSGLSRFYGFGIYEFGWINQEKYNELFSKSGQK